MFLWAAIVGLGLWAWSSSSRAPSSSTGSRSSGPSDGSTPPPEAGSSSDLIAALEVLPPTTKGKAIEAVVMGDVLGMRKIADEADALGHHDLAQRLRFRADVLDAQG